VSLDGLGNKNLLTFYIRKQKNLWAISKGEKFEKEKRKKEASAL